ncbi:helix-turn-helix domain-containing protein [Microbacterium album]|uniref:HTH cro/C1-type domain-containing protein n=1 Tax=Microbacterium album TaxID=2053191 RepID=A0A917IFR2_9MICO|nr:helix-turn-helix transcriptional regulator [Microbacterium album]GGH45009.1 hypothetical protein GCM10010921_20100 [Microbacterium album]
MVDGDWENDFTRAVARNLAALREAQGLTIEAFARRCDEVVGVDGRFKPNTLQALFSGKRKGVTATELFVFAEALHVPILALLIPMGGNRGMPLPSGSMESAQMMWQRLTGYGMTAAEDEAKLVYYELHELAEFVSDLSDLRSQIISFFYSDTEPGGSIQVLATRGVLLEQVRSLMKSCREALRSLERSGISFDRHDPLIAWCLAHRPELLTEDGLLHYSKALVEYYASQQAEGVEGGTAADADR